MTRPPSYHYQRADELVAELEQADPQVATKLPSVAFKLRLAELHAQLAQSPWWPGIEARPVNAPPTCQSDEPWTDPWTTQPHNGRSVQTRTATGDRL